MFTDGESIEEVIINAKDVLEGTIFSLLKNNLEVPEPTLNKTKFRKLTDTPIIITTAKDNVLDKVELLDLGANDGSII